MSQKKNKQSQNQKKKKKAHSSSRAAFIEYQQALMIEYHQRLEKLMQDLMLEEFIDPWERDSNEIDELNKQISECRSLIITTEEELRRHRLEQGVYEAVLAEASEKMIYEIADASLRDTLLQNANQLFNAKQYDDAIAEFMKIIRAYPNEVSAYFGLAKCYKALFEQRVAIHHVINILAGVEQPAEFAIKFDPIDGVQNATSIAALNELQKKAQEYFESAVNMLGDVSSTTIENYRALAEWCEINGRFELAREYYQKIYPLEGDKFYKFYTETLLKEYSARNFKAIYRISYMLSSPRFLEYVKYNFLHVYESVYEKKYPGNFSESEIHIYLGAMYQALFPVAPISKASDAQSLLKYLANAAIQCFLLAFIRADKELHDSLVEKYLQPLEAQLNAVVFKNIFGLFANKLGVKLALVDWIKYDLSKQFYEKAITKFELIKADEEGSILMTSRLWFDMASAYLRLSNLDSAVECLHKCLNCQASYPEAQQKLDRLLKLQEIRDARNASQAVSKDAALTTEATKDEIFNYRSHSPAFYQLEQPPTTKTDCNPSKSGVECTL